MLKVSRLADYAVALMGQFAMEPERRRTAAELAVALGMSPQAAAKILKMLARAGLLVAVRGKSGGYGLARDAQAISLLEVVEAVDGAVALTACAQSGLSQCAQQRCCSARDGMLAVGAFMSSALAAVPLSAFDGKSALRFDPPRARVGARIHAQEARP